jgi:hypothetical protein
LSTDSLTVRFPSAVGHRARTRDPTDSGSLSHLLRQSGHRQASPRLSLANRYTCDVRHLNGWTARQCLAMSTRRVIQTSGLLWM